MVGDLSVLLDYVPADGDHEMYRRAILDENILGKKTASTRLWAYKKLRELYALDRELPVFRALRLLWDAAPGERPMLALLAATARDALLRLTMGTVAGIPVGTALTRDELQAAIIAVRGERFSVSTMEAILSHLITSWTESGHLAGRRTRVRAEPAVGPASTAYALFLGYLAGARGLLLFSTPWADVLGVPATRLHDFAREASRRGWLTYRGIGDVVDVTFERLLTPADLAALSAAS